MRPAKKSRESIKNRATDLIAESLRAIRLCTVANEFNKKLSVPKTMSRISGMAKGWAHHYPFCNDIETVKNVDKAILENFYYILTNLVRY
jgi:hypothetical protein